MTEKGTKARRHEGTKWRLIVMSLMMIACAIASGCQSAPRNMSAVHAYYRYDFTVARESLRGDAYRKTDEQIVLNNTRLGMAALADGDLHEAEVALGKSFEYLSTAGLNKDKTIAAVMSHEGVRVWKGEPFEQALTYYQVALLYALMGDWENMRAAAANSLFRLTDFHGAQRLRASSKSSATDYTAVDTNFALGFLMQAIGSDLSGAAGSDGQYEAASKINPSLHSIVDEFRTRDFDTILIVDYGKGPTKVAYGEDKSLARFVPQDRNRGLLEVHAAGVKLVDAPVVCDVNAMAVDHKWNNLEGLRKAKSMIGTGLLAGGIGATAYGAHRNDEAVALAGIAAIGAGLLTKAGAKADTRYCEFMPQSVYVVPLKLDQRTDLRISVSGDPKSLVILDDVQPGSTTKPAAIYLRILGPGSPAPQWLAQRKPYYGNDAADLADTSQNFPWILGGRDVSTPSSQSLSRYQASGYMHNAGLTDLREMYDAEGIHIGSGMENRPEALRNPSYRHVLEGGTGLFTPYVHSMGYKRLMFTPRPPYQPKSPQVRNAAASIGVNNSVHVRQPVQVEIQQ